MLKWSSCSFREAPAKHTVRLEQQALCRPAISVRKLLRSLRHHSKLRSGSAGNLRARKRCPAQKGRHLTYRMKRKILPLAPFASLSVQGQTPDALFDALAAAQIDFRCQLLCRVRSTATSPLGHRLPVDKKFAGQTSGPSSRSSSTVLFGAVRMSREEDRSMPENGMRKRELMRPSLGEGQLQQPAPRGTYSYGRVWKQVVQDHHCVFVCCLRAGKAVGHLRHQRRWWHFS